MGSLTEAVMGNPHPTKSKPCKIGRKHTNAPSDKAKQRRQRGLRLNLEIKLAKRRKKKHAITDYYAGMYDQCPVRIVTADETGIPR